MSLRLPMAHSYNNDMHACDCHMIEYNIVEAEKCNFTRFRNPHSATFTRPT